MGSSGAAWGAFGGLGGMALGSALARRNKTTGKMGLPPVAGRMANVFAGYQNLLAGGADSPASQLMGQGLRQQLSLARQFGPQLARLQTRLQKQDPLGRLAWQAQQAGLSQLGQILRNPYQIDSATSQAISEGVAGQQSRLGMLDSPQAAISDITAQMGGAMNLNAQRIQSILGALSGAQGGNAQSVGAFSPFGMTGSPGQGITGSVPTILSNLASASQARADRRFQGQAAIGQGLGGLLGLGMMAIPGMGPAGAAAAGAGAAAAGGGQLAGWRWFA